MTTEQGTIYPEPLNARHQRTYDAILRQPVARNLEWKEVRSLLAAVADVAEGQNGSLQMSRYGRNITLHTPKHKDIASVEEIRAIGHFLEKLSAALSGSADPECVDLLVVIGQNEAKIYRTELLGDVPQRIEPYDPYGFGLQLHSKMTNTSKRRQPERKSFYNAIAATLRDADAILVLGTGNGTGESIAMGDLMNALNRHADVFGHIIGAFVVDEHHQTVSQLLTKAREIFEILRSNPRPATGFSNYKRRAE